MGARIINRRLCNQQESLFAEADDFTAEDIREAGAFERGKYHLRDVRQCREQFENWWEREGRQRSRLPHSEAKTEFVQGCLAPWYTGPVQQSNPEYWIAGAIKHPGALRRQLGIPAGQTIPLSTLQAAAKAPGKLGQRARLALRLRSF